MPHSTEQIDAIANEYDKGDEIYLSYTGKDDPELFLQISMKDDIFNASFDISGDNYVNYTKDLYDEDQAWYQARVDIENLP